jgi:hypothetical protein
MNNIANTAVMIESIDKDSLYSLERKFRSNASLIYACTATDEVIDICLKTGVTLALIPRHAEIIEYISANHAEIAVEHAKLTVPMAVPKNTVHHHFMLLWSVNSDPLFSDMFRVENMKLMLALCTASADMPISRTMKATSCTMVSMLDLHHLLKKSEDTYSAGSLIYAGKVTPEAVDACKKWGTGLIVIPSIAENWDSLNGEESNKVYGINEFMPIWRDYSTPRMERGREMPGYNLYILLTECTRSFVLHSNDEPASVTTTYHDTSFIKTLGRALKDAGYISGQTYEQCLEMAKWHPDMAQFMAHMPSQEVFDLAKTSADAPHVTAMQQSEQMRQFMFARFTGVGCAQTSVEEEAQPALQTMQTIDSVLLARQVSRFLMDIGVPIDLAESGANRFVDVGCVDRLAAILTKARRTVIHEIFVGAQTPAEEEAQPALQTMQTMDHGVVLGGTGSEAGREKIMTSILNAQENRQKLEVSDPLDSPDLPDSLMQDTHGAGMGFKAVAESFVVQGAPLAEKEDALLTDQIGLRGSSCGNPDENHAVAVNIIDTDHA